MVPAVFDVQILQPSASLCDGKAPSSLLDRPKAVFTIVALLAELALQCGAPLRRIARDPGG
jgi:hypothetical protein